MTVIYEERRFETQKFLQTDSSKIRVYRSYLHSIQMRWHIMCRLIRRNLPLRILVSSIVGNCGLFIKQQEVVAVSSG